MTAFLQQNIGPLIALPMLAIVILALRSTWLECREALTATFAEFDKLHKEWDA